MGKNKRKQIAYFDSFHNKQLMLDSIEEADMLEWLIEAQKLGYVVDWEYQPSSIELFQNVNYVNIDNKQRCLFRSHIYSPDFKVTICPNKSKALCKELKLTYQQSQLDKFDVTVDVKGGFNKTERAFGINQKWVYQKFNIYICKIVPKDFFMKVGCPMSCFITRKTGKKRKMYQHCKSIEQALSCKSK